MEKQSGQTLIEVLVALTVTVIMIVALISFILSGLKNAQFAQNQSKATKLAQETMDQVKNIRDRNGTVIINNPSGNFSDLWASSLGKRYFILQQPVGSPYLSEAASLNLSIVDLTGGNIGFKRQIILEDNASTYSTQKKITVIIKWSDSTGEHESNIQTILSPGI